MTPLPPPVSAGSGSMGRQLVLASQAPSALPQGRVVPRINEARAPAKARRPLEFAVAYFLRWAVCVWRSAALIAPSLLASSLSNRARIGARYSSGVILPSLFLSSWARTLAPFGAAADFA